MLILSVTIKVNNNYIAIIKDHLTCTSQIL